LPTSCVCPKR